MRTSSPASTVDLQSSDESLNGMLLTHFMCYWLLINFLFFELWYISDLLVLSEYKFPNFLILYMIVMLKAVHLQKIF